MPNSKVYAKVYAKVYVNMPNSKVYAKIERSHVCHVRELCFVVRIQVVLQCPFLLSFLPRVLACIFVLFFLFHPTVRIVKVYVSNFKYEIELVEFQPCL